MGASEARTLQNLSFSPIFITHDIPDLRFGRPVVVKSQGQITNAQRVEHPISDNAPVEFCLPCSQLNLSGLFENESISKPKRRAVGSIAQCESTKAYCEFCRFLIQACELAYPREANKAFWNDDTRKRVIYLANDSLQRPWYRAVAVDLDVPLVPYAWLQVGLHKVQRDHWVCVNVVPSPVHTPSEKIRLPRLRRLENVPEGALDCELIKRWQHICRDQHGQKCNRSTILERRFLKLYIIDVESRSIKIAKCDDRYIALSYVWGSVARPPYEKWNWKLFSVTSDDGNHEISLPDRLPRTVEDAITLTKRLGERYLWVDAFCINQHDSQHQTEQINNMDLVYQCAYLTIIALDGNGSDAGLAGVSRPLEQVSQPQAESYLGPLVATHLPAAWVASEEPPWDKRAWTMQENLLSRRCLILDRNQTTWKCQEEYFHDSMNVDLSAQRSRSSLSYEYFWDNCYSVDISYTEWIFYTYSDFLSIYTGRQLTVRSDVLNACRGILNHLTRNTEVGFFQGLPKTNFLPSLMWKAHPQHCLRRREGFPSWSWTGWEGRTEYTYWLHDIESFPDLASKGEASWRRKRPRLGDHLLLNISIPEPARILTDLTEESTQHHQLRISSSVATFRLKLVRNQGKPLRYLKFGSLQQREAVGDQWTLLDPVQNVAMRDSTGECATFENTDYFFQVHPEVSGLLQLQHCVADLLFVKFWPWIRDSEQSDHWERNLVGALVLTKNEENEETKTMTRIASLVLPLGDWLKAKPELTVVTIV